MTPASEFVLDGNRLPTTDPGAALASRCRVAHRQHMTLSLDEVRALPAVVDVMTAAEVLGIGRTVAYELVRTDRFPTPVFRLGKQIRVPTAYLIELLGLSTDPGPALPRPAVDG
jgi:predicted DNA-binding transcriptional regulator AlpA